MRQLGFKLNFYSTAAFAVYYHLCIVQVMRSHIALLLLLCLTRTLLPEAWILGLHAHTHTTTEPAHAPEVARKGRFELSAQHQHCAVEQFYHAAFQAAGPVLMPQPRLTPCYAIELEPLALRAAAEQQVRELTLRGPPSRV